MKISNVNIVSRVRKTKINGQSRVSEQKRDVRK